VLVEDPVVSLPVSVDAPFVRTRVRAYVTAELRFRIHALALPMSPERSFHRVTLATVRAHVSLLARFVPVDGTFSLSYCLSIRIVVVSVFPFTIPQR